MGVSSCVLLACLKRVLRASITRTNSKSNNGLPCRKPRAWQTRLPDKPFNMILVLVFERRMDIQSIQHYENPMC
jgi:hypothetical protein